MLSFEVLLTYFRIFSGFKYLKIAGASRISFLDRIRVLTLPDSSQVPIYPSNIGKAHHMLAKR